MRHNLEFFTQEQSLLSILDSTSKRTVELCPYLHSRKVSSQSVHCSITQQEVSVFDFDPVEGAISNRRTVAHIPKSEYGGKRMS